VKVLVHSFSNNGWLLYGRLLKHFESRRTQDTAGGTTDVAIVGLVMDSAPETDYSATLMTRVGEAVRACG
jgi:hypothetical protein